MEAMATSAVDTTRLEIDKNKDNVTALNTIIAAPWVSDQGYRGTASILWSCTLTISACIYTVLHLNISSKKEAWPRLLEKFQWVLTGLLLPELILYMALSQFLEARNLVKKLKDLHRANRRGQKV